MEQLIIEDKTYKRSVKVGNHGHEVFGDQDGDVMKIFVYSHPQLDGAINHHWIARDLLFHVFGDDYHVIWKDVIWIIVGYN